MSAVTQNQYTQQNNTTVLYNFTFPYLKTSDVKVSLDGVATTAFTLANATTIQLNTAPSVGTNIRIFRETGIDDLTATFYAGSAIKSEDLNDNFTQNLFVTQEVNARFLNILGGNKMIEDVQLGQNADLVFEGSSDDANETTLSVVDPTADQTYRLPNLSTGTYDLVSTGDTGTVARAMIANDAVNGTKIDDNSIDSEHYVDGSIDRVHLAADIVDGTKIADDVINSEHYVAGSIDREHLAADIVDGTKIADDAIANEHIATDAVNADSIANNAVDTLAIQNLAITNGKLADNAVTQAKMADDSVGTAELVDGCVDSDRLAANSVTLAKMTDNSVGTSELVNDAVTEVKIADNAVSMDKLSNGALPTDISVASANIVDGTIVEADIADDAVTNDKILDGTLDGRYFTETELLGGSLDGRYYTETEAEAKFLRQDSSETIASGVTWSASDAFVATTAAIDLRIIELVDDVGGFVPIANETSFPATNPDINSPASGGTIVSVKTASTNLVPSSGTVTIANGRGTGNAVVITGVTATIPSGFGFLVETTSTDHTYAFHRLVPKATEVTTVANNVTNIVAAGANVTDINNFVDLYQISTSAPTARADSSSLQVGDLWFDSSSNKVLMIYDGSSGDGFTAATPNASDLVNINIVAGQITYQEDLGLITNAVSTGSGNNSVNTVAGSISNVNTAATNIAKITTVADDLNEGTSEIDTVATNITNVNNVGNNISNVNAVHTNASNINAAVSNASNINAAVSNATNINTVAGNNTNINTVAGANSNITTVAGSISNVNTVGSAIANVNTTASNIANVNNFAATYQIASSNPSQDGGGNSLAAGDLYFNTSSNELRVYNGSTWQGGVTATGNLAGLGANTFTGNQTINANIIVSGTVDGVDIAAFKTSFDNLSTDIVNDTTPQLGGALDGQNNNMSNIGTIDGSNLQLDFGTI